MSGAPSIEHVDRANVDRTLSIERREPRAARYGYAIAIAAGRPVIFKLHPAEDHHRAAQEIRAVAPDAVILRDGNTEHMIANATAVVAHYSTVAFTAALLGKEVHSYIEPEFVRKALPLQNGGASAANIAAVCRARLQSPPLDIHTIRREVEPCGVPSPPRPGIHVMPAWNERSMVYPVVQALSHALRPPQRRFDRAADAAPLRPTDLEPTPAPRPVSSQD